MTPRSEQSCRLLTAWFIATALSGCVSNNLPRGAHIAQITYRGWTNALMLANGEVEAIVVPEIGRVMQFRFKGESSPFWQNEELPEGRRDFDPNRWLNFGGDKSWPSPEDDWKKMTGRSWPPPAAFDPASFRAFSEREGLRLLSGVDPYYGIRVIRRIKLDGKKSQMTIVTTFEKMEGAKVNVAVWTITQTQDPVRIEALPNADGKFRALSRTPPPDAQIKDGILSLSCDPKERHKIGLDGERLLWVGKETILLIESRRRPEMTYPDRGSSAEVYTNPKPQKFVELEMLGPLREMAPGDKAELRVTYTLMRRSGKAGQEAELLLPK